MKMTLKGKWQNFVDTTEMYSWIFVNGLLTIENDETYQIILKENYVHRTPYYEIHITKAKGKRNENDERFKPI